MREAIVLELFVGPTMNAADQAIKEIREVRHRISAGFDHDIGKLLAHLKQEEEKHQDQIRRGRELLAKRNAERQKSEPTETAMILYEKPK